MSCGLAGTLMGYDSTWIGLSWGLLVLLIASITSMVLIVLVLVNLPATYYQDGYRPPFSSPGYDPGLRWLAWVVRNILGLIMIVVGVFLSIPGVPGQGLLTILIGVIVLDFPGKRRLERKLVGRPEVLRAINRLRNRFGKPPLVLDSKLDKPDEQHDSAANSHGAGMHSSRLISVNGQVESGRPWNPGSRSRN
jgi:hypothetical protein